MKKIPAVRFMRYVSAKPSERGCWLWTGTVNDKGRGVFKMDNGKSVNAPRAAYALFRDASILDGDLHVCHVCDVGLCVNPDHLFPGTHTDNMRDAALKGRHGGFASNAKLTPEQSAEIIRLRVEEGLTQTAIGARFGISHTAVWRRLRKAKVA